MKVYNVVIGNDHSGCALKTKIIDYITSTGLKILDCGAEEKQGVVDYPDFADKVTETILSEEANIGILICGTGLGMSITANRRTWIRAALCTTVYMAEKARAHNDANILILGSKIIDDELAISIVDKFLSTVFDGGRHATRLEKIN